MPVIETDVLVVGGGGAGAISALHARQEGAKVAVVLKGEMALCGATPMAVGAAAAVGPWRLENDNPELFFRDTIKAGQFMNEQRLVRILVDESPDRILELERYGLYWDRTPDGRNYDLHIEGGHTHARGLFFGSRAGMSLVRVLRGELIRRDVDIHQNIMVTRLLTCDRKVCGAMGLNLYSGELFVYRSKAIVLATGGAGQLYLINTHDVRNVGDGYALALQAGASLMDMEFIQFYPLAFVTPDSLRGMVGSISDLCHLYNTHKERFMEKVDPERLERATRDVVARAILREVQEGRGTKQGGVFCDMTFHPPGFVKKYIPTLYDLYLKVGYDMEKEIIEVAPTYHYTMGGIRVDERWASDVEGLYAAGEAAGGVHGANRLGQNSLSDILVSGKRAGAFAARHALGQKTLSIEPAQVKAEEERIARFFRTPKSSGLSPIGIKKKIRTTMTADVGVVRSAASLKRALAEIQRIKEEDLPKVSLSSFSRRFNRELIDALDVVNMQLLAEAITRAALMREESRGAHYREDFPGLDNRNWLKHIAVRLHQNQLALSPFAVDLQEMRPEVKEK